MVALNNFHTLLLFLCLLTSCNELFRKSSGIANETKIVLSEILFFDKEKYYTSLCHSIFQEITEDGTFQNLNATLSAIEVHDLHFEDKQTENLLVYLKAFESFHTFEYDIAEKLLHKILEAKTLITDQQLILLTYNDLGTINYIKGRPLISSYYYDKAMTYIDEKNNPGTAVNVLLNATMDNKRQKKWFATITSAKRALRLIRKYGIRKQFIPRLYNSIGISMFELSRIELSKQYFICAIDTAYTNSFEELAIANNGLGLISSKLGLYKRAAEYFSKSLDYQEQHLNYQYREVEKILLKKYTLKNAFN